MDIPEDIWSHIATYLAPEDLRALLTLNRTFLRAALNARYRRVTLHSKGREGLFDFTRLQDPLMASRVRTLYLVPSGLLSDPFVPPLGMATKFIRAVMDFFWTNDPLAVGFGTPYNVAKKMDSIFANLKHLDDFKLFCHGPRSISPITRIIIHSAWSRLRTNIHTLELVVSPLALEQAISPSLVFPNLEALTLKIRRSDPSTDADALRVVLSISLPFVTNHRQTLRHFSLADQGVTHFDFSPFWRDLGYFPRLQSVDASIALNNVAPDLWHFLGLHSNRLETLTLTHYQPVEFPSYNGPVLSALKVLSLRLTIYTMSFMASLLRGSSLQTLKLYSVSCRHSEVPKILDLFAGPQLRSLLIRLDTLSPQVLDYMSKNLPNLHTLTLQIYGYTGLGTGPWDSLGAESSFCEAMANRDYSHWQPSIFDLEICAFISTGCEAALNKLFPQIKVKHISHQRWIFEPPGGGWVT